MVFGDCGESSGRTINHLAKKVDQDCFEKRIVQDICLNEDGIGEDEAKELDTEAVQTTR
jgi:hypothetical protein